MPTRRSRPLRPNLRHDAKFDFGTCRLRDGAPRALSGYTNQIPQVKQAATKKILLLAVELVFGDVSAQAHLEYLVWLSADVLEPVLPRGRDAARIARAHEREPLDPEDRTCSAALLELRERGGVLADRLVLCALVLEIVGVAVRAAARSDPSCSARRPRDPRRTAHAALSLPLTSAPCNRVGRWRHDRFARSRATARRCRRLDLTRVCSISLSMSGHLLRRLSAAASDFELVAHLGHWLVRSWPPLLCGRSSRRRSCRAAS